MIHKCLFSVGYSLKNLEFLKYYNLSKSCEFSTYENLKRHQEEQLHKIISHAYNNVPYYFNTFNKLNLMPADIQSVEDLQKLPILTKEVMRANPKEFRPHNLKYLKYNTQATGGSTGNPFQYKLSNSDEILGLAIMYANWGYAGYELGDKIGLIAGSSLISSTKSNLVGNIKAFILNEKKFSSFEMSHIYMNDIILKLNICRPLYIRGYASSIYLFAKHVKNTNSKISFTPKGVFTTAEVLFEYQRDVIEDVFNCPVFDQYGLNDGGVSAYECEMHSGLHVDMVRSIMEIVDSCGNQLEPENEGHILATSLYNYAMPFIRYDSGDMGVLSKEKCKCGRHSPLLKKIVGRVSDFIYTPNGKKIHGEFFSHIFWEFGWVKQFQIVQTELNRLTVKIVPDNINEINEFNLDKLNKIILNKTGMLDVVVEVTDRIEPSSAGKWRFILRDFEV